MWGNKRNKHHGRINTIIGKETKIFGDIDFSGGLHVDGHIVGNIASGEDDKASITISEHGLVEGEIHIPNIIINGKVEGNIYSSNHLELVKKARIYGNVYYNVIEIAIGAEINGNLEHGQTAIEECDDQQALFSDQEISNNLSLDSDNTADLVEEGKK
jgi:cytoskeletal protein CcmA (bactofilin family)